MFDVSFEIIKYMASALIFLGVLALFISLNGIKQDLASDDRLYMDPLPKALTLVWPMVNFFAFYFGEKVRVDSLEKIANNLQRSGITYLMTPEQYVGLTVTSGVLMAIVFWVCMALLNMFSPLYLAAGAVLGLLLPKLSLRDLKMKRENKIVRALPTYLDYLTMAVQAGMNMSGAIQQAVDKGPEGPLNVEFRKVTRDIKAGMSKMDSLRELSYRNDIREINSFVTAVIQSEKTGASIGNTLKLQADQRRVERFQRAEKLAMEAPVKLIFPLVVFIFPLTFLVLFFPIVMKFIYDI